MEQDHEEYEEEDEELVNVRFTDEELRSLGEAGVSKRCLKILRDCRWNHSQDGCLAGFVYTALMMVLAAPFLMIYRQPWGIYFLNFFRALPDDSILARINFVGPVLGIFFSIGLTGWLLSRGSATFGRIRYWVVKNNLETYLLGVTDSAIAGKVKNRLDPRFSPEYSSFRQSISETQMIGKWTLVSFLLTTLFFSWDIASMPVVTKRGVASGKYFTYQRNFDLWENAYEVTLSSLGTRKDLEYQLRFKSGRSWDIASEDYKAVKSTDPLQALAEVDRIVRERGIPRVKSERQQRDEVIIERVFRQDQ